MTTQEVKRKLTAILSADVKGYSRLMGEDEKGTVRTLNVYKEVMTGLIQHHRGRVVDAPGDNVLAEFGSVVDAVECAAEIQKELKTRNADFPENRKMEFRIGVNLGDVIEDGEQILGDGVNIAARLESMSDAGGICISGTAYDHVENKLSLGYKYLGEQTVKNIAKPVRVYRVLMEPEAAGKVIVEKKAKPRQWQWVGLGLVVVVIAVSAAVSVWRLYFRPTPTPPVEVASKEKMAFPLPDKPSIAVLPFANMSGDKEQEYFSDGITENIITGLSKMPRLFVIARNSTFMYKGKGVKIQQVAEELGVRYVLEGSVQKSGNRVRVTAQLIDALTGNHLWAERYDRDLKDIFAVQDEITMRIMEAMQVKLTEGEQWLKVKPPRNLEAYLKFLQAQEYLQRFNIEGNIMGKRLAEETIVLDPEFAGGYNALARGLMMDVWLGSSKSPKESLEKAVELTQKAISLDPKDPRSYALLGYLYTMKKDYDRAIAEGEKALALDPSGADTHAWLGMTLNYADRPKDAIPMFEKAIRLNPLGPTSYFINFGTSYRMMGQYQEAITQYKKALRIAPNNVIAHIALAATYSLLGSDEEARAEVEEALRLNPKFSLERFAKTLPFKNQAQTDRFIDALRKAGLK